MKHRDKRLDNAKQYRLKNADKIKDKNQKPVMLRNCTSKPI
jgi:hypothetical protein